MINQKDKITVQPPSESEEKECVACHEKIRLEAGLCPFCRTTQYRSKKQFIIAGLKWIGGVTAIITLVISSINLNDIVTSAKRRSTAVEELVTGAAMMRRMENVDSASNLLSEALKIDPISKAALELQVEIAMEKVRDVIGRIDKGDVKGIEPMLPIIERGTGELDNRRAADALAHLGWINYLRSAAYKEHYKTDIYFQEAFKLDPDNCYAHVLRANWCLANQRYEKIDNPFEQAMRHYREVEKSSRKINGLEKIIWRNLANTRFDGADILILDRANDYRKRGKDIDREAKKFIMALYCKAFLNEKKIKNIIRRIPSQELKKTFDWIQKNNAISNDEKIACGNTFEHRYISIMLDEISGDASTTMARYRTLIGDIRKKEGRTGYHYTIKRNIVQKIFKFLNIRPAAIGTTGDNIYGEEFEKLTQNWCCGYRVKSIEPSGPADLAGMKYDDIIIAVNEQILHGRFSDQIAAIGVPGEDIHITLLRNGDTLTIPCRPAEMDDSSMKKFIMPVIDENPYALRLLDRHLYPSGFKNEPRLRARITDLTDMACNDFSISPGTRGVLILYAQREARFRGLKVGDAILTISGVLITQSKDLVKAINQAAVKEENAIKIDVFRDGNVTPIIFPLFKKGK